MRSLSLVCDCSHLCGLSLFQPPRKVLPEQIQMAIAAQSAAEDDQKLYELDWTAAAEEEDH